MKPKKPINLPCGIVCENCSTCVFRHYALTEGRCSNCRVRLKERGKNVKEG